MRRHFSRASFPLLVAVLLALSNALPVQAQDVVAPLVLTPADYVLAPVQPGEPGWALGTFRAQGGGYTVSVDQNVRTEDGSPTFRVDYDGSLSPSASAELFVGVRSGLKRNLYKARGIAFVIRGSQPVAGALTLTSSNPEKPKAADRFFGSFMVGTQWRTLRIPFRSMAPHAAWAKGEAQRQGFVPGDLVLRPDNIEELRIGFEGERAPGTAGSFWVGGITFFR